MYFAPTTVFTKEKILTDRVNTRNQVNIMSNELRLHFKEVLAPFIGKKVVKVTPYATWTVAVKKELQKIEEWMKEQEFRLSYTFTDYSIHVDLDKSFKVSDCGVDYVKQSFKICELTGTVVLESLDINHEKFRTDYTVDEIMQKRDKIRRLESELSALKFSICEIERSF